MEEEAEVEVEADEVLSGVLKKLPRSAQKGRASSSP